MKTIHELQKTLFNEYQRNGYERMWTDGSSTQQQKRNDLGELGLIVTEVAEAMELVRNKKTNPVRLGMECADIIIRSINFMSRKGLDASKMLRYCINKNEHRGQLHGRAV